MFHSASIQISTRGRAFYDLTREVQTAVHSAKVTTGLCTVFVHHTSASLLITENADPAVHRDLETFISRLAPDGDASFTHTEEGPDDMPSHVRCALTQTSLGIPIAAGRCDLGTWQGVYLWEHRHAPHTRKITISIVGE